jgi:hypothetical protein
MSNLMPKSIEMIDTNIVKPITAFSIQGRYKIIGSNSYRNMRYANDYDIQTDIKGDNLDYLDKLTKYFKHQFVKAKESTNIIITDFKCGFDKRFEYIGDYSIGSIKQYLKNPLITDVQRKTILGLNETEQVKYIKDLFILRWDYDDIMRGYKELFDGEKRYFRDCLLDKTIMKIDLIIIVGNQLAEVSENYIIRIGKKNNIVKEDFGANDFKKSLEYDIIKHAKTNSFKSLKRLLSLLIGEGDRKNKKKINSIIDFLNSQTGALYQVKSSLELLVLAITQTFRKIDFQTIYNNFQFIKTQISKIFSIDIKDSVFESMNEVEDVGEIEDLAEHLITYFQNLVNKETKSFLKSVME